MFSSPLQRAILRGMKPSGDLVEELQKLGDYTIRSRKDAKAICGALKQLPLQVSDGKHFSSPLHALTVLFQEVEGPDAPAFDVLYNQGVSQLIRIFDALIEQAGEDHADDLLLVLKILALYGSRTGAEKIVEAARRPLKPDAYMWHVILSTLSGGHPQRDYVFQSLSDPLPSDFLAIALLDSANQSAVKEELQQHPFDSSDGWQRLQSWLESRDPEDFSYAHSATAAIPFLSNPTRDRLLTLGMDHIDAGVQLEAAWAAGKLGREAGLKILARYCMDTNHSDVAQRYLAELDCEYLIPAEAREPSFQAQATFANWLAHPNELGKPPDALEIVDHRLLTWPPERDLKPFWLIRFRVSDRTGLEDDNVDCGLVGSTTWCFFSKQMHQRPPEDAYAIHCYWEMQQADLIHETEVADVAEYAAMLGQWRRETLQEARITRVAELSPALGGPGRFVALASAKVNNAEGWVVLDGPRSTWYPKIEQPDETHESVVLMIHVGRQLLDFQDHPDRKKWHVPDRKRPEPQQIIKVYESLITEAGNAEPKRQKDLLGSSSLLSRYFDAYVESKATINGTHNSAIVIDVYDRFLRAAEYADGSIRDEVYGTFSVVNQHFDSYVDALVSHGRSTEIVALIELLAPYWDNNYGYGQLGSAAFKAGRQEIAEPYLLKLRDGLKDYCRAAGMSMLAEIWHDRGETQRASDLLTDCLRKLVIEIQESKYNSDRRMFGEEFQHHRATYLRLFPNSEDELSKLGLPTSPLD